MLSGMSITHNTISINIAKRQKLFFINYNYKIIWTKRNIYIYYILKIKTSLFFKWREMFTKIEDLEI